ncbi:MULTISPECIES: AraC family transcriptional regulator [Lysobacter]|uniref:AraC family transcriptional regulator n=1 Tax=Lysobacter soli TaxID=453783 RepID=A0A3D8VJ79_9GAMM|nr:AraC family transcriptional regulator [Lysobacter soli]QGW64787.1 helix-turn-helix domain-containing protein [Lysobacter soli]RDY69385.1 AraC family transcriptional regulator [Lysobacter soli]UTA53471.1 AraC family transcriptional regulator [Lysobacter soli]
MPSIDSPNDRPGCAALPELAQRIARSTPGDGVHATAFPPLSLVRLSGPTACTPVVYEPRLVIVAQGSKTATLAGQTYVYNPLNYLVVSVTLPVTGQVIEATPDEPYLCLRLDIDPDDVAALIAQSGLPQPASPDVAQGLDLGLYAARVNAPLMDAVLRLMRLLDTPDDLPVLGAMARREILYRVLTGELGHRLRALATKDTRSSRIARAVARLREDYLQPLSIDELARTVHMSTSSFHHQFKAVTTMSPLQFQKHLRLHEARRLMMAGGMEALSAARHVGYESPSQFSREYKRLFGAPPRSEVGRSRGVPQV